MGSLDKSTLAAGSIAVGLAVLGIKFLAYWLTGSVALLSDALESLVNVVTALAALAAIRVAARPPDATHPYGHDKAEFLSAVLGGAMILLAGVLILYEAIPHLLAPTPVEAPVLGLIVSLGATLINWAWSEILIRRGDSPALEADGRHLRADVITSAGVVTGVALAAVTGLSILDPLIAVAVALHILRSGWTVLKGSLSGLMDEAVPEETLALITRTISENAGAAMEMHDLKTRNTGATTFIDFHLIVPGRMTVHDAHEICDRIEHRLEAEIPDAKVTIHIEPGHKSKPEGIPLTDPP